MNSIHIVKRAKMTHIPRLKKSVRNVFTEPKSVEYFEVLSGPHEPTVPLQHLSFLLVLVSLFTQFCTKM